MKKGNIMICNGFVKKKSGTDPDFLTRGRRRGTMPPMIKPPWIIPKAADPAAGHEVPRLVRALGLATVCESACCPNRGECFGKGTATFLILGKVCTRRCGFCAVAKGSPGPPDPGEPAAVAEAVRRLGLAYAVVTSVTRDDLPDGGAAQFAATIRAIRKRGDAQWTTRQARQRSHSHRIGRS